jgi:hypothetical protein
MIKAASTSEKLVNFYQTARRKNPEDRHLHSRRRENLESHEGKLLQIMSFRSEVLDFFT